MYSEARTPFKLYPGVYRYHLYIVVFRLYRRQWHIMLETCGRLVESIVSRVAAKLREK